MELPMKASGWMEWNMATEIKSGLMEVNIKVSGKKIKQMEKAGFFILMVMFMMVIGLMIRQMVKEHIHIQMEPNILVSGKMTSSMGLEFRSG